MGGGLTGIEGYVFLKETLIEKEGLTINKPKDKTIKNERRRQ